MERYDRVFFQEGSGGLRKKVGTSRGLARLSRTRPLAPSLSLFLIVLSFSLSLPLARSPSVAVHGQWLSYLRASPSSAWRPSLPGMSFAGDVDLTISPLPRTAASCTTHWRLPRRFQSVVNPTRIATSSFVGHFSGQAGAGAGARARPRDPPSGGGDAKPAGPLWRTRCQSRDISLLYSVTWTPTAVRADVRTGVAARGTCTRLRVPRPRRENERRRVSLTRRTVRGGTSPLRKLGRLGVNTSARAGGSTVRAAS